MSGYTLLPGTRAPVRVWTDIWGIEHKAAQQLRNISQLPWVQGVAVMPDVHFGIGATVGSVIAMKDAVSPAAVGVDIGCGMSAVLTSLTADMLPDNLGPLRGAIEDAIPVGFNHHSSPVDPGKLPGLPGSKGDWNGFWMGMQAMELKLQNLEGRAHHQMGTLGGGNHFIEVCLDDEGRVWLMLHSGSRNIGKELAERHMAIARDLPHNAELPDRDLAVFVTGTREMDAYRRDLFWAQDYARRNRAVMMTLLCGVMQKFFPDITFEEPISCHHNYVSEEEYEGIPVLVTRKGAISAGSGQLGIIPGSMGTSSYIVRGLGNTDAYCSASHGAGRRMSRGEAKRTITLEEFAAQTAGVECRKDQAVLDEAPGAYKAIEEVMANQGDLVEVVAHLKQVLCVKG